MSFTAVHITPRCVESPYKSASTRTALLHLASLRHYVLSTSVMNVGGPAGRVLSLKEHGILGPLLFKLDTLQYLARLQGSRYEELGNAQGRNGTGRIVNAILTISLLY